MVKITSNLYSVSFNGELVSTSVLGKYCQSFFTVTASTLVLAGILSVPYMGKRAFT
jgi:hypothetical protein